MKYSQSFLARFAKAVARGEVLTKSEFASSLMRRKAAKAAGPSTEIPADAINPLAHEQTA